MNADEPSLEDLFADLVQAKQRKKAAEADMLSLESKILEHVADRPEKGRAKLKAGPVSATIEFGLTYKAEVNKIVAIETEKQLPVKLVEAHYELDERAYEALRESDPELFATVAQFVTTKPKKPSFELKL